MMFIALPPLIFLSIADHIFLRELGEELSIRTHNNLVQDAQNELRQLVDSYARIMEREISLVSLLLYIQTEEAQRRLNAPLPLKYSESNNAPSLEHYPPLLTPHSTSEPSLNFEQHSIYLPPGVSAIDVDEEISRLDDFDDVLKKLHTTEGDIILWQYISLKSGVHLNFPGNSYIPEGYDARKRSWFQETINEAILGSSKSSVSREGTIKDEVRWFPLIVDSLTGQVTMTATLPIRNANDEIIGVSGIDLKLTEILSSGRLPSQWSNSRLLLIALANTNTLEPYNPAAGDIPTPVIIADTELQNEQLDWKLQLNIHPLVIESTNVRNKLIEDMLDQNSGIMNVMQNEKQAVWGYASIGPRACLLVMVPFNEIDERASVIRSIAEEKTWQLIRISTVVLIGVIILVIVLAWSRSRTVTEPILRMARAAERIASGDLDTQVHLPRRSDEIGQLANTFNAMVPKLQDHLRLSESIDLAMQVQQALLPEKPPVFHDLDIAGCSLYCDETGGDYYDFITFENAPHPTLGVAIGDVVGHGIAAALLMATTRALLRVHVISPDDLKTIFKSLNAHLCESRFAGKFMTLFYMNITQSGQQNSQLNLNYISAGHDPALVYDMDRRVFTELSGTDIPLGVLHDWPYSGAKSTSITPGKILFFGTDGIWETRNENRDFYGKERLQQIIRKNSHRSASSIADVILNDIANFRNTSLQEDDITLIIIKYDLNNTTQSHASTQPNF
ncbi:SpoIIE family protein phosphatase [Poriferisphaera corsica]|nr:SpoIIE family protein phosphatase [Poriferisphaera corsica]